MTPPSFRRTFFAGGAVRPLVLALACAAATGLASAPWIARGAQAQEKSSAPVERVLPPSNSAILLDALRGASSRLVKQAPLTPGTKVALRPSGETPLDQDVRDAVIEALTRRGLQCVLLPPGDSASVPGAAPSSAPAPPPAAGTSGTPPAGSTPPPSLSGMSQDFAALQAERQAQAARAESLARMTPGGGTDGSATGADGVTSPGGAPPAGAAASAPAQSMSGPAAGTNGPLPILSIRVLEARVDYVRQFRGGLFGAQRIERRALASLTGRLSPPASDAVSWTANSDSTVGDVVLKSDLASLEDRQRPETRGTVPSAGFKKVLEPLLVVVLIAGLVSLFYQNRP
ncbi:MAG: hypothetical protein ACREOU_16260 [Candidatus Eiseniibacteriota bacterium]